MVTELPRVQFQCKLVRHNRRKIRRFSNGAKMRLIDRICWLGFVDDHLTVERGSPRANGPARRLPSICRVAAAGR